MPSFLLGSGFSDGDVLDVQEITGDFLDTTAQSIGSATVTDGRVEVVAQRVGRYLLIPEKGATVGVIVRSDGRHDGPIRVGKDGKWAKDSEAVFERLDASLNTEQSEAQTGDHKSAPEDLGDVGHEVEQPPLPEDQPVTEKELKAAIKAKSEPHARTEGMTAPQAAVEERAVQAKAKADKAAARKK